MEFVFIEEPYEDSDSTAIKEKKKKQLYTPVGMAARGRSGFVPMWIASAVVLTAVIGGWYFFLPLTYGKPGLDVAAVQARKWLGYDLHFAK